MLKGFYICLFLAALALPLLAPKTFADSFDSQLSRKLVSLAPNISHKVAELAVAAANCALQQRVSEKTSKLAIIDYSLPSTEKRFWLFNLNAKQLLLEDFVAHGRNSGEDRAYNFSNEPGSLESSLGLFRVGDRYIGKHGNSLRLIGLEPGFNDLALDRAIVIHGADYVSPNFIREHQRLGRSFGCPALAPESANKVIDYFQDSGGFLFAYYPDKQWLQRSSFLNSCNQS